MAIDGFSTSILETAINLMAQTITYFQPLGTAMTRSTRATAFTRGCSGGTQSSPPEDAHRVSHSIRHSTALHLLQSGVDITVIALWLGHENHQLRTCI